jgi:ketosteroid isomerase-like protein
MLKRILFVFLTAALMVSAADIATEVEKAERDWGAAMMKNDYAALDKLMSNDLYYRHSNGIVDTKASYVGALKSGKSRYYEINFEEIVVRPVDDKTALAFAKAIYVTKAADGSKQTMQLMTLHVFRKGASGWQLLAHQSARPPAVK